MSFPSNYIKKRDFLHSEKSQPAALGRTGRDFLAAERYSDALDFFEKARDAEGIRQIKDFALRNGDAFLLARLERYDRHLITPADWEAVAQRAESSERPSVARFARNKLAPPAAEVVAAPVAPGVRPGEAPLAEV
jgi:hypothetical protein